LWQKEACLYLEARRRLRMGEMAKKKRREEKMRSRNG
jgi:hypothetical protein